MWYSRIAIKVELLFSLGSSNSGHSSRTYSLSESDCESVTSDGSWVITPAPTFRGPKSGQPACDVFHPLEDLLIEHPTMSVYHQVKSSNSNVESEDERGSQGNENERTLVLHHDHQRSMNCNRGACAASKPSATAACHAHATPSYCSAVSYIQGSPSGQASQGEPESLAKT